MQQPLRQKKDKTAERRFQHSILVVTLVLCSALLLLPSAREVLQERGRLLVERPLGSPTITVDDSSFQTVSFQTLGAATLPDDQGWQSTTIPTEALELNGKPVSLQGYMIPLTFDGSRVTSFLLVKDQTTCCFGVGATMKDWVFVKMTRPTSSVMDVPLEVRGTFYASPDVVDGELLSLYRMSGEVVFRKDGHS